MNIKPLQTAYNFFMIVVRKTSSSQPEQSSHALMVQLCITGLSANCTNDGSNLEGNCKIAA